MEVKDQICFIDYACDACDALEELMAGMDSMAESLWQDAALGAGPSTQTRPIGSTVVPASALGGVAAGSASGLPQA